MRSPAKRWIGLLVFALILATVFVQLGQWQLRRLDERKGKNAAVVAAEQAPVAAWQDYFSRPLTDADQWHRVRIEGTYLADRQYVVRFRSNTVAGREVTGYEIVTPLRTSTGAVVLINRGFVAVAPGGQIPQTAPAAPTGPVTIIGWVRTDERGGPNAARPNNAQVRVINSGEIGADLGMEVAHGWIQATDITPAQDPSLVPASLPSLDEGPHLSYAIQWFAFTLIGIIGVTIFIRADLRERRKQKLRAEKRAARAASAGQESTHESDTVTDQESIPSPSRP